VRLGEVGSEFQGAPTRAVRPVEMLRTRAAPLEEDRVRLGEPGPGRRVIRIEGDRLLEEISAPLQIGLPQPVEMLAA
jgi:hypothetical protein